LAACFTGLEDPRETSRCDHQLIDILVIAVCAVIACAESWEDIALYGRSKQAWLATFLALPNGIPSHDTFRRVFMLIDPDAFEACFSRWVQAWAHGFKREVVAVDGKTVRRSGSRRHDHGPLHVVSAWASERGLSLGQRAVDGQSNEITAIPELLETLLSTAEQIGRMRRSKIPSRDWRGPGERSLFSLGVRGRSSEQLGAGVYLSGADSSRHSSPKCAHGA